MITELGHFALILAALVGVAQTIVPLVGAHKGWRGWMAMADPAATVQLLLVGASFAALTYAFVVSDFSLQLVFNNSHSDKPMLYKISGVWGNHEGSMLLWLLILVLFGACASWFGGNLPRSLRARVLGVQVWRSIRRFCTLAMWALACRSPLRSRLCWKDALMPRGAAGFVLGRWPLGCS